MASAARCAWSGKKATVSDVWAASRRRLPASTPRWFAHAKPGATWQDQEDAREGCRDGNRGEDEQEPDDGSRHRQQPAEDDGHQSGRRKQRAP
jgi:hypothetical protein